jgi:hypothetical protein
MVQVIPSVRVNAPFLWFPENWSTRKGGQRGKVVNAERWSTENWSTEEKRKNSSIGSESKIRNSKIQM